MKRENQSAKYLAGSIIPSLGAFTPKPKHRSIANSKTHNEHFDALLLCLKNLLKEMEKQMTREERFDSQQYEEFNTLYNDLHESILRTFLTTNGPRGSYSDDNLKNLAEYLEIAKGILMNICCLNVEFKRAIYKDAKVIKAIHLTIVSYRKVTSCFIRARFRRTGHISLHHTV